MITEDRDILFSCLLAACLNDFVYLLILNFVTILSQKIGSAISKHISDFHEIFVLLFFN